MSKKLLTAYLIFSSFILAAVIAWFGYRIARERNENIANLEADTKEMESALVASVLAERSISATWSNMVKTWFRDDGNLKAIVIHDGKAIEYLYGRSDSYLRLERNSDGSPASLPEFDYSSLREHLVSTRVVFPNNDVRTLQIISSVLSRNDLAPIFREILIVLLVFLILTALFIVFYPYIARRDQSTDPVAGVETPRREKDPGVQEITTTGPEIPQEAIPAIGVAQRNEAAGDGNAGEIVDAASVPHDSKRGLYSPESDLGWEEYLPERLSTELKRAASFDQDLVLLIFSVDGIYRGTEEFLVFAALVREYFTFRDLCFEYGASGIGVIVPNIDLEQGIEKCEDFASGFKKNYAKRSGAEERAVRAGLSGRNGRLMGGERLIREAARAMENARQQRVDIIAFRVDPEKYRAYIATKAKRRPRLVSQK